MSLLMAGFNPMVLPLLFVVAAAGLFVGFLTPGEVGVFYPMLGLLLVTVAAFVAPPGPPALLMHLTQIFIIGLVIGNIPGLFTV